MDLLKKYTLVKFAYSVILQITIYIYKIYFYIIFFWLKYQIKYYHHANINKVLLIF